MKRAALILLAACGADQPLVAPVLDVPPETSEAYPYEGLTEVTLSITRLGEEEVSRTVPFGDTLEIADIPFGQELAIHVSGSNETGEVAYGRTCAFDLGADAPATVEPHLWLSRLVKWGPGAAPLEPARTGGLAWALPDGSAAFAGGQRGLAGPVAAGVERFDPLDTGAFADVEVALGERVGARVAAFPDGRAVICGGMVPGTDNATGGVELIDPRPGRDLRYQLIEEGPRLRNHAAATLVDGRIVVAGGETQAADLQPFAVTGQAWIFDIAEGGDLAAPVLLAEAMVIPRAEHTMTRLSDEPGADVLIIGGRDAAGQPVASVEVFRPLSDGFAPVVGAALQPSRWGHQAIRMPGGFVLVIGGWTTGVPDPVRVPEMALYDPVLGQFIAAGRLSSTAGLTDLTVTPLPDGRVLLAGGRNESGSPVATTLIAQLDPVNGRVNIIATNSLSTPRAGHTAVPLCDGTVLLVGGTDDPAAPAERYNPPAAGRR